MDQSKDNMVSNSQARESSSFFKNYKLSENILQDNSQKDSQMNSVQSIANSEKSINRKPKTNTPDIPAKSAFLNNEVKGEELSEEESSLSDENHNSKMKKSKSAHIASNYSDQIRDALDVDKFSESNKSEIKKDENVETSTENVYSIFSNHWEKQYKVSDSLRQIFGNSSVDSKIIEAKNLVDIKGSYETYLNNDYQSIGKSPNESFHMQGKFRSNSDAQNFSDGDKINQRVF